MSGNNIQLADKFAKDYDEQVVKNNWTGPEILYNLCLEYIQNGQELLDIGIGTGVSALPFKNAGLKITGVDGSKEMLGVCGSKNITKNLFHVDVETTELPFEKESFDVVISNALFHLIHPLAPIFKKVSEMVKSNGIFALTYDPLTEMQGYENIDVGTWQMTTETGVTTYKHEKEYIFKLFQVNKFRILKEKTFLAFYNKELDKEFYFHAVVAQRDI